MSDDQAWHLDKRIPIALIATAVIQTVALVWYAATMASQLAANTGAIAEIRAVRVNERLPVIESQIVSINDSMNRQIASLNDGMSRLDRKMDYLLYGPGKQAVAIRPAQDFLP